MRPVLWIIISLMLVWLGAWYYFSNEVTISPTPQEFVEEKAQPTISLVQRNQELSPKQKIGRLLAVSIRFENKKSHDTALVSKLQSLQPGYVVLYGSQIPFEMMSSFTQDVSNAQFDLPVTIAIDHEGGAVQRLSGDGFTKLPPWEELCQMDSAVRKQIFMATASELRAAGIDMVFGPVVDFAHESSSALGNRLCYGNKEQLLMATSELIDIYLQAGLRPTLKHFPGIGTVSVDLHDGAGAVANISEGVTLFEALLAQYPGIAVMTSHAHIANQADPCSLSSSCISMLAGYPQSLLITDDIRMIAAHQRMDLSVTVLSGLTKRAIMAGNTAIILGPDIALEKVTEIIAELSREYAYDKDFAVMVDMAVERSSLWQESEVNDSSM